MARRKIKFENGELYHVYNRGVDKRDIIMDLYDLFRILESIDAFNSTDQIGSIFEYSRKGKRFRSRGPKLVEVVAFNILDNHYHLVLKQLVDNGISMFMRDFSAGYTKYFNEKYKRSGALFQGPFKAEYVSSNEYLMYVVDYVNGNNYIHKLSKMDDSVLKWGARSSLEQYTRDKSEWKNKYFECNIIKSEFDDRERYLKNVKELAETIIEKRKDKDNDLGPRDLNIKML